MDFFEFSDAHLDTNQHFLLECFKLSSPQDSVFIDFLMEPAKIHAKKCPSFCQQAVNVAPHTRALF